jgi:hypothetical protein
VKDAISLGLLHSPITEEYDHTGDIAKRWHKIAPILFQFHTMIFSCIYVDQGWGDKKGNICITESETVFLSDDITDIGTPTVVTSPTASHQEKSLILKLKQNQEFNMQSATRLVVGEDTNFLSRAP